MWTPLFKLSAHLHLQSASGSEVEGWAPGVHTPDQLWRILPVVALISVGEVSILVHVSWLAIIADDRVLICCPGGLHASKGLNVDLGVEDARSNQPVSLICSLRVLTAVPLLDHRAKDIGDALVECARLEVVGEVGSELGDA
jgi:hypothetical protein